MRGATPASPPPAPQPSELLQSLARTNNFMLQDLEANRAGRLSSRQTQRLRKRSAGYMVLGALAFAVCVALAVWSIATANSTTEQIHRLAIGGTFLSGLIGLGSLLLGRSRAYDVQAGSVKRREGLLKLVYQRPPTTGTGGGMPTYLYVIGGATYPVSVDAWKAAIADLRYCAYETRDGLLLSIEPLTTEATDMPAVASGPPPPPPPPAFAPRAPVLPVTKLTGAHHSAPQPFSVYGGLVVLAVTCSGSGTVGVRILSASGQELLSPIFNDLADHGGFLKVSWGVHLDAGTYMVAVDHKADLALSRFRWTVVVTQPTAEGAVPLPATYSGKRRAVVGPFACGERIHLAARNKTRDRRYASFSVEVLASDGRANQAIRDGVPNYRDAVIVSGLAPGAHWLNVDSDGNWTITISTGEAAG